LAIYYNGSWQTVGDAGGGTRIEARTRYDNFDATHQTIEVIVDAEIVAIFSSDAIGWTPQSAGANTEYLENGTTLLSSQYSQVNQGINLNGSDSYKLHGRSTSAEYADLAERYHADAEYEAGTAVKLGGVNEITQTTALAETDVFGIVSAEPAVGMNAAAGTDVTHPYIALAGRVPAKVVGKVSKGQRLVTSDTAGHLQAVDEASDWRIVVGRALEDKTDDIAGLVEVVVGVK
jgi:hypothetical protein